MASTPRSYYRTTFREWVLLALLIVALSAPVGAAYGWGFNYTAGLRQDEKYRPQNTGATGPPPFLNMFRGWHFHPVISNRTAGTIGAVAFVVLMGLIFASVEVSLRREVAREAAASSSGAAAGATVVIPSSSSAASAAPQPKPAAVSASQRRDRRGKRKPRKRRRRR